MIQWEYVVCTYDGNEGFNFDGMGKEGYARLAATDGDQRGDEAESAAAMAGVWVCVERCRPYGDGHGIK